MRIQSVLVATGYDICEKMISLSMNNTGCPPGGLSYAGAIQGTVKLDSKPVFLKESDLFGTRKPTKEQWLSNVELYKTLSSMIPAGDLLGIQRVGSLWRLYIDNIANRVEHVTIGVSLRGVNIPLYERNPFIPDRTDQLRIRIKDVPLSADDSIITKTFQNLGCTLIEPPSHEKLRVDGKLTQCETGDRILFVKPLKEPLQKTIKVGMFRATIYHVGQSPRTQTCGKCLQEGHRFNECDNDWVCRSCKECGHKIADCPYAEVSETPQGGSMQKSDPEPQALTDQSDNSAQKTVEMSATERRKKKKAKRQAKKGQIKIYWQYQAY